jgi:hypothetical protein
MKACEGLKGYAESHAMLLKVGPKLAAQIAAASKLYAPLEARIRSNIDMLDEWQLSASPHPHRDECI